MRRADRLFAVVQLLRTRRVVTAAQIAQELEVSLRTVYRDVADLIRSGVPIEGEAGVGYCLQRGFDLPPLMFDEDEIGALVLGARMVQAFSDERLAARARSLLSKIEMVVPSRLQASFAQPELNVPAALCGTVRATMERVRTAIDQHRKLRLDYLDHQGAETQRTVRPLCLAFWGMAWTMGAWCELRSDFRTFRLDRMERAEALATGFEDEPGRTLTDYVGMLQQKLREEWDWPGREATARAARPVS